MPYSKEFLEELIRIMQIDGNRLSRLIKFQILTLLNSESPDRVLEEITTIEKHESSGTATEKEFTGDILKGFSKKHYYSSRFIGKNLLNSWGLGEKSKSIKFESMAIQVSKRYSKDTFLPSREHPNQLMGLCSEMAQIFVDEISKKRKSQKLTGEWVIFKKYKNVNYYLTVANHCEEDSSILKRINATKIDFPFLFKAKT